MNATGVGLGEGVCVGCRVAAGGIGGPVGNNRASICSLIQGSTRAAMISVNTSPIVTTAIR